MGFCLKKWIVRTRKCTSSQPEADCCDVLGRTQAVLLKKGEEPVRSGLERFKNRFRLCSLTTALCNFDKNNLKKGRKYLFISQNKYHPDIHDMENSDIGTIYCWCVSNTFQKASDYESADTRIWILRPSKCSKSVPWLNK